MNYFTIIGVPQSFDLDLAAMEKRYFELQRQYHPDRLVNTPAAERVQILDRAMTINEAYQALKSPLKRAQHLLKLQGVDVNTEADTHKPEPALLMEMMELREALSEASGHEVIALRQQAERSRQECIAELSAAFRAGSYEKAAQLTMRLNYLSKFLNEARLLQQKNYEPAANT